MYIANMYTWRIDTVIIWCTLSVLLRVSMVKGKKPRSLVITRLSDWSVFCCCSYPYKSQLSTFMPQSKLYDHTCVSRNNLMAQNYLFFACKCFVPPMSTRNRAFYRSCPPITLTPCYKFPSSDHNTEQDTLTACKVLYTYSIASSPGPFLAFQC